MCPAAFWIFINSYSNVKWGASKQKAGGLFKKGGVSKRSVCYQRVYQLCFKQTQQKMLA